MGFFRNFLDDQLRSHDPDRPCNTGDIGMKNFSVCLEEGSKALTCVFRCPFGNTYLCTRPSNANISIQEEQIISVAHPVGPVKKPVVSIQ